MKDIIQRIKCLFGQHEFHVVADDYKYKIKRCDQCGKYEVLYKNLGMIYKCNYEQLPNAYKFL